MNLIDVFEALASLNGMLGAMLLALRFKYSKYGWYAYLGSNVFWLAFAWSIDRNWLFAQNVVFALTSLIGIWNYVVVDRYPQLHPVSLRI